MNPGEMIKVGENDRFEFCKDFHTEYMERKLREVGHDGLSFPRFKAYRVQSKTPDFQGLNGLYVIMDEKKVPVMEMSGDPYETDFKMVMLREMYKDRMDLVRIAETGNILVQ